MKLGILWGRPKQDTAQNDTQVQEPQKQQEADAAELSTDLASLHEPLVVSPNTAKEIMFDLPDRSAEDAASIVNDLALHHVSKSSPKPSVPGKRKRRETDVVDGPPRKRLMKESEAAVNGNDPSTTSTNGITGHEGRSNRAPSEAEQVAPGKLPRPKKEQRKRHMVQTHPTVEISGDIWEPTPSPKKQVENPDPPLVEKTRNPSSTQTTPRRRGRPPRVRPSTTTEKASVKESQGSKAPDLQVKRGRKRQPEEHVNPGDETRNGHKKSTDSSLQKARPKARPKASGTKSGDDHEERVWNPEPTRVTAVTNDHKDVISTQINEGEEGGAEGEEDDSDVEYSIQVIESEEEEDEGDEERVEGEEENGKEKLEVFGQDRAWKAVIEGARSVCGSKLPLNQMPKLLTKTMTKLVHEAKEARDLYEQLLNFDGADGDALDKLNDVLKESLDAIEDQIRRLSEKNAATKSPEMIKDIFACGIPAMVFLLQSALGSRVHHLDEPCDLETLNESVTGLREIVRLQDMAILLCEKATRWKAKPVSTSKPIIRPTTWQMFPSLRVMRDAFSNNLREQNRKRKTRQNAVDHNKRQKELIASSQQAKLEAARKDEFLRRKIRESREREDQRRRSEKRTLKQIREDEARARIGSDEINGHVEPKTTWSDAEDLALYFQLEKGYAGRLTCTFVRSHHV